MLFGTPSFANVPPSGSFKFLFRIFAVLPLLYALSKSIIAAGTIGLLHIIAGYLLVLTML